MEAKDAFLCHNAMDKRFVQAIAERLEKVGLRVFVDEWDLHAGQPWRDTIGKALESSRTVVIFVGVHGFGRVQKRELDIALSLQEADSGSSAAQSSPTRNDRRVIPVLMPGVDDKSAEEALPPFLRILHRVSITSSEPTAIAFKAQVDELARAIRDELPTRRPLPSSKESSSSANRNDAHGSMVRRFVASAVNNNVVIAMGHAWSNSHGLHRANDELAVVARGVLNQLEIQGPSFEVMPSLDEVASCYSVPNGDDSLASLVRRILSESHPNQPSEDEWRWLTDLLDHLMARRQVDNVRSATDQPMLISSSLGLAPEAALLRAGIPFVRVVPRIKRGPKGLDIHLELCDCTSNRPPAIQADWFAHARTVLGAATKLEHAPPQQDSGASVSLSQRLSQLEGAKGSKSVVLVKFLGSVDVVGSCILSRDNLLVFAEAHAKGSELTTLIRTNLSSRPCLVAGYRRLDPDFIALTHAFLRDSFLHSNDCPRLMISAPANDADCGEESCFVSDHFESRNLAVLDSVHGLGIQTAETPLGAMLKRLSTQLQSA